MHSQNIEILDSDSKENSSKTSMQLVFLIIWII